MDHVSNRSEELGSDLSKLQNDFESLSFDRKKHITKFTNVLIEALRENPSQSSIPGTVSESVNITEVYDYIKPICNVTMEMSFILRKIFIIDQAKYFLMLKNELELVHCIKHENVMLMLNSINTSLNTKFLPHFKSVLEVFHLCESNLVFETSTQKKVGQADTVNPFDTASQDLAGQKFTQNTGKPVENINKERVGEDFEISSNENREKTEAVNERESMIQEDQNDPLDSVSDISSLNEVIDNIELNDLIEAGNLVSEVHELIEDALSTNANINWQFKKEGDANKISFDEEFELEKYSESESDLEEEDDETLKEHPIYLHYVKKYMESVEVLQRAKLGARVTGCRLIKSSSVPFHQFCVKIKSGESFYEIWRRYSSFRTLHNFLFEHFEHAMKNIELPVKKTYSLSDSSFTTYRKFCLDEYLNKVMDLILHLNVFNLTLQNSQTEILKELSSFHHFFNQEYTDSSDILN